MCREKRECAELLTLSAGDVTSLDDSVRRLRDDNGALHHQLTEAHDDTALLRQQLLVMDQQLAQAHDKYYTRTNAHTHTRTHARAHFSLLMVPKVKRTNKLINQSVLVVPAFSVSSTLSSVL